MNQNLDENQSNLKPGKRNGPGMPKRALVVWLLMLAFIFAVFQLTIQPSSKSDKIPYSPDFINLLNDGRINSCEVVMEASGVHYIHGELKDIDLKTGKLKTFRVDVPVTDSLITMLREAKVHVEFDTKNPWVMQILSSFLPFLIIIGLLYFFFYRNMNNKAGGAFSFGKSRARLMTRDNNQITFKDVAGADEARDEVQEIIEFLRDPQKFQRLGGRIPKGVLLVGPPGTGKTLIARAIAGEAQVPFFSISGSDFVEMFVGVGASRVRDMFEQGKKSAPCIIFIDEIDAVGRSRFSGIGGGHDEREQTLNALLVEMDGFDKQEGVIIIAATNRPDVLDQALLRPGRFDRQIMVDLPDLDGREGILKIHARKVKLADDANLRRTARGTPGFSGADLANLINEAALLAARRGAEAIDNADLDEARDKVRWGRERRSRVLDDQEKRLTACHEAGHAITLALSEGTEPLHKVTIIPRGQALGATMQLPEKDKHTEGRKQLLAQLVGLMGGRAAEQVYCDDITTGASSDIKHATHIARLMVTEWGMSALGPQNFGEREEVLFLGREVNRSNTISEETSRRIDEEVKKIIDTAYDKAVRLLEENRDKLELLTDMLLEHETLDGRDVDDLLKHGRILSAAERNAEDDACDEPDDALAKFGDVPRSPSETLVVAPAEGDDEAHSL